jgi:hypothetical protein
MVPEIKLYVIQDRHHTVWQSPLFYCINLDKSPFFVRVTGLMRAFFMMAYLIPWNINTMSIFSLTLELYEDGDYTHPGYQVRILGRSISMHTPFYVVYWDVRLESFS